MMDPSLDPSTLLTHSCKIIASLLTQLDLHDPWRLHGPTTRDYIFYSIICNPRCRIDNFLISSVLFPDVLNASIHNIIMSDHTPVSDNRPQIHTHRQKPVPSCIPDDFMLFPITNPYVTLKWTLPWSLATTWDLFVRSGTMVPIIQLIAHF